MPTKLRVLINFIVYVLLLRYFITIIISTSIHIILILINITITLSVVSRYNMEAKFS